MSSFFRKSIISILLILIAGQFQIKEIDDAQSALPVAQAPDLGMYYVPAVSKF